MTTKELTIGAYAEELPINCPPAESTEIKEGVYFRFVGTMPPLAQDFASHCQLYPNKNYRDRQCLARSLSLFSSFEAATKAAKLPALKNKLIAKVVMIPGAGRIMQTSGPEHHSWWMYSGVDPVSLCSKAENGSW
jgi:hypothetical protein